MHYLIFTVSPCIGRVDWNVSTCYQSKINVGLSLYRESGLKLSRIMSIIQLIIVSPCIGRVDWNVDVSISPMTPPCLSLYRESGLKYIPHCWSWAVQSLSLYRESGLKYQLFDALSAPVCVSPCIGRVDWNALHRLSPSGPEAVSPCIGRVDWNIFQC